MRTTSLRWLTVVLGAVAVALSVALVDLANRWPTDAGESPLAPSSEPLTAIVKPALPEAGEILDLPLLRPSPTHVAVEGLGFVGARVGGVPSPVESTPVRVLLDTGSTVALATADAQERLSLSVGTAPTGRSRSFAGAETSLFPIDSAGRVAVTLGERGDGALPIVEVGFVVPDRVFDTHVIVQPRMLAPTGGALRLDLRSDRLVVCGLVEACAPGSGWLTLASETCDRAPELVAVDATIAGHSARLLLDTGGSTMLSRAFYDRMGLAEHVERTAPGSLIGSGNSEIPGIRAWGSWAIELGAGPKVARRAERLWVVPVGPAGPAKCFPDGSIGVDLLEGCEIVLPERVPRKAHLRCAP